MGRPQVHTLYPLEAGPWEAELGSHGPWFCPIQTTGVHGLLSSVGLCLSLQLQENPQGRELCGSDRSLLACEVGF
jgi:hypothetical protein